MSDTTFGTAELAWLLGIRPSRLLDLAYQVIPQSEWPGKKGKWAFTPDLVEKIKAKITPAMLLPLSLPDGDEMYDISYELEKNGVLRLEPLDDVAAILRELIYDHEMSVILESRNYRGTILRRDSL